MSEKKLKIIFISALVLSFSLLALQVKFFYDARKELKEKTVKLEGLTKVKSKIAEIEQDLVKEKLIEEAMFTKVPEGKESIFDLMRELTVVSDNASARNITFSLEDKKDQKKDEKSFKGKKGDLQTLLGGALDEHSFEMGFELRFIELTLFLEKLLNTDRIVLIHSLNIERAEDILPRQRVEIDLVTYTFSAFQ